MDGGLRLHDENTSFVVSLLAYKMRVEGEGRGADGMKISPF